MPFAERGNGRLINIENKSDVEVKNLHLFHALTTDVKRTHNKCFYIKDCNNVSVHDVFMENANYGMDISGTCEHIFLKNLHIERVLAGIEYTNISDSFLKDSYISCDYNLLYSPTIKEEIDAANKHHCVYIAATTRNCTFKNLTLVNAGFGNAINRNQADSLLSYAQTNGNNYPEIDALPISENLVFENIIADNCDVALFLGKRSKNVIAKSIVGTNLGYAGLSFEGVENALISNSHFSSKDGELDAYAILIPSNMLYVSDYEEQINTYGKKKEELQYYDITNYYLKNVVINNCTFDFHRHFIGTAETRETENDELTVKNCNFIIHELTVKITPDIYDDNNNCMPSQIKGTLGHAVFKNCRFEYNPSAEISTDVQKNGAFFYLRGDRGKKMLWEFHNCSFINNGDKTINSVIIDRHYVANNSRYVFIVVKRCKLKGFRFILRKSKPNILDSEHDSFIDRTDVIDPAWSGIPDTAAIDAAVTSLNNTGAYLSQKNIYFRTPTTNQATYYVKAEEYGF